MRPIIPPLTSLRFFAALLVVVFHYNLAHPLFPASIANFGYEAVTFFFVLSGFILTYTHGIPDAGLNIPWRTFLIARLVRLCPAYYLAIIAILLLFLVAGISDRISVGKTIPVLLMVQAWTKQSALSLNPPAWSISNELFFYLVFPAVWNTNRFISTIAFVAGSAALVVVVAVVRSMHPDGPIGEAIGAYFPLANLPQFLFGVGLARLWLETPRLRYTALFLLGMASIIALMAFKATFSWLTNDVSLCAAFGLTVLGTAGIRGSLERILSGRSLVALGNASYSMYIMHFPTFLWWNHYTRVVYVVDWPPIVDFVVYFAILTSVSLAILFFLERPLRSRLFWRLIRKDKNLLASSLTH